MSANIALSTAGVIVSYCVETTAGTRPTTGYTEIPDIKDVPSLNPEPETLDSTVLSETEYKTYIAGLKDLGGALSFTANLTEGLMDVWGTLCSAYTTAKASNLSVWFQIAHPDLDDSVYFTGQPSEIGLPEMSVNAVLETDLYITPTNAPAWETKIEVA